MEVPNFQPIRIELLETGMPLILEGSLPLTLNGSQYKRPNSLNSHMPPWLSDWLCSTGLNEMSGNFTSDEILKYSKTLWKLSKYLLPNLKESDAKLQLFGRYVIFLNLAAQHEEMVKMRSGNSKLNQLMADLVGDVMKQKYENIEDLPDVPKNTIPLFRALFSVREDSNSGDSKIANFGEISYALIDAMMASIQANSRLDLEALVEAPKTFQYFKRHAGAEVLIELAAITLGFYLPRAIRQDLLVQRLIGLASAVVSIVTDVRELGQRQIDTPSNIVKFTMKNGGLEMAEAFKIVMKQLEEDVNEFKIVSKIIAGIYKRNLRLLKYVKTVEIFIDGSMICDFENWRH